jgi:hypothetical protein
MGQHHGVGLL